jgi:hypothetical protein
MCQSCQEVRINGVKVHEAGCPEAWRDTPIPCWVCGFDFLPIENPGIPSMRRYAVCPDCRNEAYGKYAHKGGPIPRLGPRGPLNQPKPER